MMRSASVSDSISMVTPAATAWVSSAGVLPGPAKLTRSGGHRGVERREHLGRRGDVERIDELAEMLHDRGHGIGLHGVAEVEPGGQMCSQQGHALGEEAAVVGEEGSAAGALGETVERHSPDRHAGALAPGYGQGVHEAAVTS